MGYSLAAWYAVATLTPNSWAIFGQEKPEARSDFGGIHSDAGLIAERARARLRNARSKEKRLGRRSRRA
jgi:hypothetical protein